MSDEVHDTSRVDNFLAARNRAMVLHSVWRPMLAGAVGAALVIGAVAIAQPRFTTREVIIPQVVMKDTVVPNIISKDAIVPNIIVKPIELDIPRIVAPSPLARTPAERSFTSTDDWRASDVRGRLVREQDNGFILETEDGSQQSFSPARLVNGKPEPDLAVKDLVAPYLGDLCLCHPLPTGLYQCEALHAGRAVPIPIVASGRPT
jgi:hypothetical protein